MTATLAPSAPLETIAFADGQRHDVLAADAERLVIAFTVPPMPAPNAPHVHDAADEVFVVQAGRLRFTLDGVTRDLHTGDQITIPRGVEHFWQVVGPEDLHAEVTFTPGCAFHAFLRDLAALQRAGRVRADGSPGLRDFALLQRRHRAHLRVTSVPQPVLWTVVALGSALAAATRRALPAG